MIKKTLIIIFILLFTNVYSQTIINDPLQGSTNGTRVGGTFTSEGYKPGTGENHILYKVPQQIPNGYVEVQVKGFNFNEFDPAVDNTQTSFFVMYDGRGIPEPLQYKYDYRNNYFRFETVYRSNKAGSSSGNRFKGKIHTAADTPQRISSSKAVFPNTSDHPMDWAIEPNGQRTSWDKDRWYTIRTTWDNKTKDFKIFRDGVEVWHNKKNQGSSYSGDGRYSSTSPYPWLPIDFRVHLGSGPRQYSSKLKSLVYRNFKVVQTSGGSTPSPSVVVLSPNGGEQLKVGTTYELKWNSNSVSNVKIEFSVNGGSSYSTIASSTPSDGSYNWTVPDNTSSNCLVKITSTSSSSVMDQSNDKFLITKDNIPPPPSGGELMVLTPSAGQTLSAGGVHNITWSGPGSINALRIYYSLDNGANWTTIVSRTDNDGSHSWNIPNVSSNNCLVRMKNVDDFSEYDVSSVFTISKGTLPPPPPPSGELMVLTPSAGQTLSAGSVHNITWSGPGSINALRMYYSLDNGANWTTIVSKTANDGSHSWNIPNVSSTKCLVRIKNVDDFSEYDISSVFSIGKGTLPPPSGELMVLTPSAGQALPAGGVHNITWSGPGSINTLRMYYSLDNGDNWTMIVGSASNNGSYRWNIPNVSSNKCLVRIKNVDDFSVYDISDNFIITNSSNLLSKNNAFDTDEQNINVLEIPTEYELLQNYPNPFNPTTNISFGLPKSGYTTVVVYNSLGQEVNKLMSEFKSEGNYSVEFNATGLSSGIYFYTIRSGNFVKTNKMILSK